MIFIIISYANNEIPFWPKVLGQTTNTNCFSSNTFIFCPKNICVYYFASIKHICGSTFKEIQVFDGYDESLSDFSNQ